MIRLPVEYDERTDQNDLLHYRQVVVVENDFVPNKGNFAIYERTYATKNRRHGKQLHSYDIFLTPIHKAGTSFHDKEFSEDTEYYPGSSYFGKGFAKCCFDIELAKQYLNDIVERCRKNAADALKEDDAEEESQVKVVISVDNKSGSEASGVRRGRKALDASGIVYPDDNFTLDEFEKLNAGNYSRSYLYVHLRELIEAGKFQIATKLKTENQRGKPTNVYARV
jgi:hypothetical protein